MLAALAPLVFTDIGAARQHAVHLTDTPTPTVAREDTLGVKIFDYGLHTHLSTIANAFQREPVDQADRVGMQWVNLQLFLGLGPALLRIHDPIAYRRQRTVPEALTGVF